MKKNILISSFIFLSFFFIRPVFAVDTLDQSQPSSGAGYQSEATTSFAQSFIPTADNLSRITVYTNTSIYGQVATGSLYSGTYGEGTFIGSTTRDCTDSGDCWSGVVEFYFAEPLPLTPSNNYYFVISAPNAFKAESANDTAYTDGELYPSKGWPADMTFWTYYDNEYIAPIPDITINSIFPLSTDLYVSASSTVLFSFNYNRELMPDALAYAGVEDMNNGTLYTIWPEITEEHGTKTFSINLPNGTYGWTVILFDQTNLPFVQLASTTPEYFGVNIQQQTENLCAGIQTTTGITDFHLWGDLLCGTKTFSVWAFTPTEQSLNDFSDRFDDFKDSFPFNAFFDLTDTVSGAIATSSTESMSGTLKIPFITATGTFNMLPVLASSSLPNLVGTDNAKLIRDSITWFLWLGAGVLVFLTFKKI
jgi:hypothetical protein